MVYQHPFHVYTIDAMVYRPQMTASHLIVENGHAAWVDVGSNSSSTILMNVLKELGIPPEQVDVIFVTHVHLDHAGGAGTLLQQLPNAKLVVHPRGAKHLMDPSKLIEGALQVYGKATFERLYGTLIPVAPDRVILAGDNTTFSFQGRPLLLLDTPGHARHHYCIYDEKSRGIFTGDTFGISYREFDTKDGAFIFPTTTPVQFDPVALSESIQRLMYYQPECAYLTHFGRVSNLPHLAEELYQWLEAIQHFTPPAEHIREAFAAMLWNKLHLHNPAYPQNKAEALLKPDIDLNTQGILYWLESDNYRVKKQEVQS